MPFKKLGEFLVYVFLCLIKGKLQKYNIKHLKIIKNPYYGVIGESGAVITAIQL